MQKDHSAKNYLWVLIAGTTLLFLIGFLFEIPPLDRRLWIIFFLFTAIAFIFVLIISLWHQDKNFNLDFDLRKIETQIFVDYFLSAKREFDIIVTLYNSKELNIKEHINIWDIAGSLDRLFEYIVRLDIVYRTGTPLTTMNSKINLLREAANGLKNYKELLQQIAINQIPLNLADLERAKQHATFLLEPSELDAL